MLQCRCKKFTSFSAAANINPVKAAIEGTLAENGDSYVYVYAGLTWNECWASEGVYAARIQIPLIKLIQEVNLIEADIYGTKFAANNWNHKSNGIQLGLTDSIRCQIPKGYDGIGYWKITVYALGYEDYTFEIKATEENVVKLSVKEA